MKIIDPRSTVKYLGGHIPGALSLPATKVFDPGTLRLKSVDRLTEEFASLGVDTDATVVLCDSFDGQNAAMLAWVLEYLGHEKVKILSSFIEAWAQNGRDLGYRPVKPDPARFESKETLSIRASLEDVKLPGRKLIDLRSVQEFNGELTSDPRGGHIPGAINLPWTTLLGDNAFLRSKPELERAFRDTGVDSSDDIVTYCNYGPRAALGFIALQQLAYSHVRVYDGSFHQWTNHPELPVEAKGRVVTPMTPAEKWANYVLPGC